MSPDSVRCDCAHCEMPKLRKRCLRFLAAEGHIGADVALGGPASCGLDVEVLWPRDDAFYLARIVSYDSATRAHALRYFIDGQREVRRLWTDVVRWPSGTGAVSTPSSDEQVVRYPPVGWLIVRRQRALAEVATAAAVKQAPPIITLPGEPERPSALPAPAAKRVKVDDGDMGIFAPLPSGGGAAAATTSLEAARLQDCVVLMLAMGAPPDLEYWRSLHSVAVSYQGVCDEGERNTRREKLAQDAEKLRSQAHGRLHVRLLEFAQDMPVQLAELVSTFMTSPADMQRAVGNAKQRLQAEMQATRLSEVPQAMGTV
jgi:hypothetical protein